MTVHDTDTDTQYNKVPPISKPSDDWNIPFEDIPVEEEEDEPTQETRRFLTAVMKPGFVYEICCIEASLPSDKLPYNKPRTINGYFDNVDLAIKAIKTINTAEGIYLRFNPCQRGLLAHTNNRFRDKKNKCADDKDIIARHGIFLDLDPDRDGGVKGIPTTNAESKIAADFAQIVRDWLTAHGFPQPIELFSGNGRYLFLITDLTADDDGLVERFLKGLGSHVDTDKIHVDKGVFNPGRLMRVPGTWNRKGDGTEDRPHRMVQLISVPDAIQIVTREQLEAIAVPVEQPKASSKKSSSNGSQQSAGNVKLPTDYCDKWGISYGPQIPYNNGWKWKLDDGCPFCHNNDRNAFVYIDGTILGFKCSHNSCQGLKWKDLRRFFEPDYDKKKSDNYAKTANDMRDYLKANKEQEQEEVWIDGKKVEDPYITAIRRKIVSFLKDFPPFDHDPKYYNHYLSQILCELPATDHGNAIRLSARYGHLFRYVSEQKAFYAWDGKRWTEDKVGRVMAWARETAQFINIEANSFPPLVDENGELLIRPMLSIKDEPTLEEFKLLQIFDKRDRQIEALEKWSKQSQSKRALEAMMGVAQSERIEQGGAYDASISIRQLDCHDWLFNCINGTLDLEDTENIKFVPHNPHHLITKLAPVTYDPHAQASTWDKCMLKFCSGNQSLVQFHQDLVGCGLVGKQLDDILAIPFGPGGNGKGVFSEKTKGILGDYAGTAKSDLLLEKKSESINNDQAALNGVRFLTLSETDEGRRLSENTVKSLTGGDTLSVRFLFKEYFDMIPKFTPLLFTNHRPIIQGTDQGIWRRVKFIPWMHDFEHDPEVKNRQTVMRELASEDSGILNWAIEGLKHRMQTELIQVPELVTDTTTTYRKQSDTLREFIEDYCVTDEEDAKVNKQALYKKYSEYAENEAGQSKGKIATMRGFMSKLRERRDIPYYRDEGEGTKSCGIRYILGIRLLNEGEEPHQKKEEDNLSETSQHVKKMMEETIQELIKNDVSHDTRTLFVDFTNHVIQAIESDSMVKGTKGNYKPINLFNWVNKNFPSGNESAINEMCTALGR